AGSETNNGDGDLTYSVSPSNAVYGAGSQSFNYSTSGGSNYTANSTIQTITINQASSIVQAFIDGVSVNSTFLNDSLTLNFSSRLYLGSGYHNLSFNQSIINRGNSEYIFNLTNLTLYPIGLYNVTSCYDGNTNYTSSCVTIVLNLSDTLPVVSSINQTAYTGSKKKVSFFSSVFRNLYQNPFLFFVLLILFSLLVFFISSKKNKSSSEVLK
ncbi:MAG: hypothetical protein H7836_12955, partial [Magnetococcus sp. YQC-3]